MSPFDRELARLFDHPEELKAMTGDAVARLEREAARTKGMTIDEACGLRAQPPRDERDDGQRNDREQLPR